MENRLVYNHFTMAEYKKTEEAVVKIKEVAALDGSVEEMAYYVGVSKQTIYNWFESDRELLDEVTRLRERPVLLARQTIVRSLSDANHAFRYIERKKPKEFAPHTKVEHSGSVETAVSREQLAPAVEMAIREKYERELRDSIVSAGKVAEMTENAKNNPMAVTLGGLVTPHAGPITL